MKEAYEKVRSVILANLGLNHTVTNDLLKLCFAEDIQPDQLTYFFSKYDLETLDYQSVWLISKLASRLHYAGVPRGQLPRIKGIVKKFTVENGRRFSALPGLLEAFNKAGIGVMLLNGTAMKVFYDPGETRYSGNVDILVHERDSKKTRSVLEEQGFRFQWKFWEQSTYQKNDVRIIVYSTYLRANVVTGNLADIWNHSLKAEWQGKQILVPSPEMMLLIFLVLGLEACCVRIQDAQNNFFVNCFLDSKFFLDYRPLGWDKFVELAKKSRLTLHTRLMLDVLNHLYPGSVPEEVLDALLFTDKDVSNVQRLISYNVAKKLAADAKARRDRMGYYYDVTSALWNLNCYYGNRSSLFFNMIDFPKFVAARNKK